MQNNETQQLKYSELLAVWTHFGLNQEWQARSLPAIIVKEQGDALAGTTQDLIDVSIRCEMDGGSYVPPPACIWCGDVNTLDRYWTYGHRRDWWVCSQCKRVYPCRHASLDDLDESRLTGTCSDCGMALPYTFIAEYLHKTYKDKAEQFRVTAEACRENERLRREQEKLRKGTHGHREVLYTLSFVPAEGS
jgi:hypothetical protein